MIPICEGICFGIIRSVGLNSIFLGNKETGEGRGRCVIILGLKFQ